MKVLVGCELSGVVRRAFRALGADAWSCDLEPSDDNSPFHYQMDVFEAAKLQEWDLGIFHPPCTHLSVSGARHFAAKRASGVQQAALQFVRDLMDLDIPQIVIENPISIISSEIRKPDQIIQPWMFGHPETKATCLWMKNLPLLRETNNVFDLMMELPASERHRIHHMPPGADRAKKRSETFTGIAEAMAAQWGPRAGSLHPLLD